MSDLKCFEITFTSQKLKTIKSKAFLSICCEYGFIGKKKPN